MNWKVCTGMLLMAVMGSEAIIATGTADDRIGAGDLEPQGSVGYPNYYHADDHHHHHDYHDHYDHHDHHEHRDVSYVNDYAVKALLIPLAGVALLGAAAIAASNPVLLNIGVLTGKKRRRRDLPGSQQMEVIEKFLGQLPRKEVANQERRLQAQYLHCSGLVDTSDLCFERITCELGRPKNNSTDLERNVLDIVTTDIMKNEFINPQFKFRLREARRIGVSRGNCSKYQCKQIDL